MGTTSYLRLGRPHTRAELDALRLDGLLAQLTGDCWVRTGIALTPATRIGALPPPPDANLAYSHRTALWVWWGGGTAPAPLEFSPLAQRRYRGRLEDIIHESRLAPEETVVLDGRAITAPERTVFDVIRHALVSGAPPHRLESALRGLEEADRAAALEYLSRPMRKPHIREVRKVAARLLGADQMPFMR